MEKQALVMRSGTAQALSVLGTQVRFLCESESTGKTFSLMEVVLPVDAGPPLHDHDWDEAYYVTKGEVEFTIGMEGHRSGGRLHLRARGDASRLSRRIGRSGAHADLRRTGSRWIVLQRGGSRSEGT